ncbi:ABC transporter permease [Rhodococcus sp. X156]|uniref:ABC transporter permease n=1 Tax=Rhodococcus sp. X156 TaxID=2499145 RepID=UPI001F49E3A4|nr:ABC transporter permease [Rhodococcus sp. X156]
MPTSSTAPDALEPDQVGELSSVIAGDKTLPDPAQPSGSARRSYLVGAGLLVAGIALVLVGALGVQIMVAVRVLLALVGLVPLYKGMQIICRRRFGARFDLTFWLCCTWLAVLVAAAIFAPLLPLAEHADTVKTIADPSFASPELFSAHPLGTNNFGLDLLSRVIYGARASLVVAFSAALIGMLVGGSIGVLAGYLRGKVDTVVGVLTNSLLAVPALILLIALASVLAPTMRNVALALSVLAIPSMIRLARANTLTFAQREFVLAARAMGATRWRVMFRELVPNVVLPVASLAMVMISVLIVAESSLSFLGLGIQPPQPTWGNMIAEGEGGVFEKHPHIVLVPGLVLFLTVFAFNLVGEKARQRVGSQQEQVLT